MIGIGLTLVTLIVSSAITIIFLIKSKHIETMAKIEHGIAKEDRTVIQRLILNLGIFLCFLGLGITAAYVVSHYSDIPDYASFPASILFAGGLGLIVSYLVNNRIKGE